MNNNPTVETPPKKPRPERAQQEVRLSYQVKLLIATKARMSKEKAAQLFRLGQELEGLGY